MQFPDGPYYAWHIRASFENNVKLPLELKKHTNHFNNMDLLGKEITPQTVDLLLSYVRQKKAGSIYISPFVPDAQNDEALYHELNRQAYCHMYAWAAAWRDLTRKSPLLCLKN